MKYKVWWFTLILPLPLLNGNQPLIHWQTQNYHQQIFTTNQLDFSLDLAKKDEYKKIYAKDVDTKLLSELLKPNKPFGASYQIIILPVNADMENKGYVNFFIINIQTQFTNNVPNNPNVSLVDAPTNINVTNDASLMSVNLQWNSSGDYDYNNPLMSNKKIPNNKVWTTKNLNLFLAYKFAFYWNDDFAIGAFLQKSPKTTDSLTTDDIWTNFINQQKSLLPAKENIKINIDKNPSNITQANDFGVFEVSISFKNTQTNQWTNNTIPTIKRVFYGLKNNNNKRAKVMLNTVNNDFANHFKNTMLDGAKIQKINPNFPYNKNIAISELTPSQLINALNNANKQNLTDLLTTNFYLANNMALPPLYFSFMNQTSYNNKPKPFTNTGLEKILNVPIYSYDNEAEYNKKQPTNNTNTTPAAEQIRVSSIQAQGDDTSGMLHLVVFAHIYDAANNILIQNMPYNVTIMGLKQNALSQQNQFFRWKTVGELKYDDLAFWQTNWTQNQKNTYFLQELSNNLFEGDFLHQQERDVAFTFQNNTLTATLTFKNNQQTYQNNFTFSKNNASNNIQPVSFQNQASVMAAIPNYQSLTPKELIDQIATKQIPHAVFVSFLNTNTTNYYVIFQPTSTNDGLAVEVIGINNNHKRYFINYLSGLKKGENNDFIYNITFEQSDQSALNKLLSVPFDQISEADVVAYLQTIPIFSQYNQQFNFSDLEFKPNPQNNSLHISFLIPKYDQKQRFMFDIFGFIKETQKQNNSSPQDAKLTLPLSVSIATILTMVAGGSFVWILIKKRRLYRKNKKANN